MKFDSLLYRQIHPSFVQADRVSSQAFRPTEKDQLKLSAYNSEKISADKSLIHYTTVLNLRSAGVLAVQVDECQTFGLSAYEDPAPFPEHALIDYSQINGKLESIAKSLRALAEQRGWLAR